MTIEFNDFTADPSAIDDFLNSLFDVAKSVEIGRPDLFTKEWNYHMLVDRMHNHRKFWGVYVDKENYYVHFGRMGTNGQIRTKHFTNEYAAKQEMRKMISEKYGKGYRPVKNLLDIR